MITGLGLLAWPLIGTFAVSGNRLFQGKCYCSFYQTEEAWRRASKMHFVTKLWDSFCSKDLEQFRSIPFGNCVILVIKLVICVNDFLFAFDAYCCAPLQTVPAECRRLHVPAGRLHSVEKIQQGWRSHDISAIAWPSQAARRAHKRKQYGWHCLM